MYLFNTYTSAGLAEAGAVSFILLVMSASVFFLVRSLAYDDGGYTP